MPTQHTPRTDAVESATSFGCSNERAFDLRGKESRKLELELAEVTKQRDELERRLNEVTEKQRGWRHLIQGRDNPLSVIFNAWGTKPFLAVLKGPRNNTWQAVVYFDKDGFLIQESPQGTSMIPNSATVVAWRPLPKYSTPK